MFKAQFNISPQEFGFVLTARHSDFFFQSAVSSWCICNGKSLMQDMSTDATYMFGKDSKGEIQFTIHPVPRISADDWQS